MQALTLKNVTAYMKYMQASAFCTSDAINMDMILLGYEYGCE